MRKIVVSLVLAFSAAMATAQPTTPPITPLGPESALLSLTAQGSSRRTPDLAVFTAGVVTQAQTASEAMAENSRRMDAVVAALRQARVVDRDIQTAAINLSPRYSNPDLEAQLRARQMREPYVPPAEPQAPRIIGYEARNNVRVQVRNLQNMGRIIDTLIENGANEVHGPSFTLDEPDAALDEARAEAIAEGRQRAELYARAAGMRVARILSISETGGYYPVSEHVMVTGRAMRAPPAPPPPPTPVSPGEVGLQVNVSMQFELVR